MNTFDPFNREPVAAFFEERARKARLERKRVRGAQKQLAALEKRAANRAAKAERSATAEGTPYGRKLRSLRWAMAAPTGRRSKLELAHPRECARIAALVQQGSAVRTARDVADWSQIQAKKSFLYRIVCAVVLKKATIAAAIQVIWDRALLGDPPSEDEIRALCAKVAQP